MDIMNRILVLLDKKGLNQADICKHLGIKYNVFTTWKTRGTDPPTKYLVQICDFLDISLDYLLTGQDKNVSTLSCDEQELLNTFNKLSEKSKGKLLERAASLAEFESVPNQEHYGITASSSSKSCTG